MSKRRRKIVFTEISGRGSVLAVGNFPSWQESTSGIPDLFNTGWLTVVRGPNSSKNNDVGRFMISRGGFDIGRQVVGVNTGDSNYLNRFDEEIWGRSSFNRIFSLSSMNHCRCMHIDATSMDFLSKHAMLSQLRDLSLQWKIPAICSFNECPQTVSHADFDRIPDSIIEVSSLHDGRAVCNVVKNRYGERGVFDLPPRQMPGHVIIEQFENEL